MSIYENAMRKLDLVIVPKEPLLTKIRRVMNSYHYEVDYCNPGYYNRPHFHIIEDFFPKRQPKILCKVEPDVVLDMLEKLRAKANELVVPALDLCDKFVDHFEVEIEVPKYLNIQFQRELASAYTKYIFISNEPKQPLPDNYDNYRNGRPPPVPLCLPPPPSIAYG